MKNIHVLPTDKPSRLRYNLSNILVLTKEAYRDYRKQVNQNIYITSDEEIKDKCYVLSSNSIAPLFLDGVINTASMLAENQWRKVILTDNKDLIKNGVQAIDDEFLEWFVKNPWCDIIDIETMMECEKCGKEHCDNLQCRGYKDIPYYKIIIPKEEATFENSIDSTMNIMSIANSMFGKKEEPKQETLEEAKKRILDSNYMTKNDADIFEMGAKWQQEQDKNLFSELVDLLERLRPIYKEDSDLHHKYEKQRLNLIEQFKKK